MGSGDGGPQPPSSGKPFRALNETLPVLDSVADYEKLHRVGEGTYGVVYKARDRATGEIVALKKIRFDTSRDGVPVTSIRELRVLQAAQHPNIVQLKKVVTGTKADSLFLVFEFCEHDLGRLLDSMRQPFSLSEVKCLVRQLLESVAFLHDRWLLHRDLKTSNLLYNCRGELKLCDFGLARYFAPYESVMTPRVVTLWYRAPEVLLGSETYSEAIDMWSVGCILGELLKHEPLFPADNELECLVMMVQLLGAPNTRIWPGMSSLPHATKFKMPEQPYNLLRRALPSLSEEGISLLNGLLTYDPAKRLTARQALRHPFFFEKPFPKHPRDMPTFPSSHTEGSGHKRSFPAMMQAAGRTAGAAPHHHHHYHQHPQDVKRQYVVDRDAERERRFGEAFGGGQGGRLPARAVILPQHR